MENETPKLKLVQAIDKKKVCKGCFFYNKYQGCIIPDEQLGYCYNSHTNQDFIFVVDEHEKTQIEEPETKLKEAVKLLESIIYILDVKSLEGCTDKNWFGFQNGNGVEVGKDINNLIVKSKEFIYNLKK